MSKFLIALLFFVSGSALAGGGHKTINYNYETVVEQTIVNNDTGVSNKDWDTAKAMSAAGDTCVFDYAPGWQGCVGGGWSGGESALNGSLVTRIDQFSLRVNLQTDTNFDEQAYGVGGSWHF